jgi:bifunctional DNA-binding transcriptional regulator/antitoxin component of YhaV-PrlF toxin-antitoxin module
MAWNRENQRWRGHARLSSKNRVTIPDDVLAAAGISSGDHLMAEADGRGRIVLSSEDHRIDRYAGTMTGVFGPGFLDGLRSEWHA